MIPVGISRATGRAIAYASDEHLEQSVGDILTTPIGSEAMLRDYGAALADLVDQPANPGLRIRIYAAAVNALRRWEPRLRLTKMTLEAVASAPGRFILRLQGRRTDRPERLSAVDLRIALTAPTSSALA